LFSRRCMEILGRVAAALVLAALQENVVII
jgi:hypothetical protein